MERARFPVAAQVLRSRRGFSSYHPGGCNFGLADGSSRFIKDEINQKTLENLSGRNDGGDISDTE